MSLRLSKSIECDFTKEEGSDFTLICGRKTFKVHKLVLMEYDYFEALFRHRFQESVTQSFTTEDDQDLFTAIVKHMYGAYDYETLEPCRILPPTFVSDLLNDADASDVDEVQNRLGDARVWSTAICPASSDPEPWQSRIASTICKQLLDLYTLADKYLLFPLKKRILKYIHDVLTVAWNHSDVLVIVELVFGLGSGAQGLQNWLVAEIETRAFSLLLEPEFNKLLNRRPELENVMARLALRFLQNGDVRPTHFEAMKYCSNGRGKDGVCCRRNRVVDGKRPRTCTACKSSDHLSAARGRLWDDRDDARWKSSRGSYHQRARNFMRAALAHGAT